jgi:hypothetical protein
MFLFGSVTLSIAPAPLWGAWRTTKKGDDGARGGDEKLVLKKTPALIDANGRPPWLGRSTSARDPEDRALHILADRTNASGRSV